ncbi:MAG: CehA/McbA family metallohydrolase [Desulfobacteraceae bacterium]|nr:CehA/McbA family metallohydrolase [Desulfobacteraceae bacterium]
MKMKLFKPIGKILLTVVVLLLPLQAAAEQFNTYFGDLHTHTGFSDGKEGSSPADAFAQGKNSGEADFLATTDHAQQIDSGEWADTQAAADDYTDANFISIDAYEHTRSWGHMNTFNLPELPPSKMDKPEYYEWISTYSDSISQWNHPTSPSDNFEDFSNYSPEADAVIHLIEVINGGNNFESSYILALDKGWHVGPAGNSDTHTDNWITGYKVRTAIQAGSLSREDIFDAIRNHRVYATEDGNLQIKFEMNGQTIGSKLAMPDTRDVFISVEDPDSHDKNDMITTLEIISNGGNVEETYNVDRYSVEWKVSLPESSATYYWLKVTNAGGEIAYTAPIWMENSGEADPDPELFMRYQDF